MKYKLPNYTSIGIVAALAVTGAVLLGISHAATPALATEAETGVITAPAITISDSTAATGKAVKFGMPNPTPSSGTEKFGMSAPAGKWDSRLADVGGSAHIKYRRVYHSGGFGENLTLEKEAAKDGMIPIISYKTGVYSWADVANGKADADLRAVVAKMNEVPGPKFISIHHEPATDGTAADWSAMQLHALPILKTANNVTVGVIGNGWWWSSNRKHLTDAEIAEYIPKSLIAICDVIAADTYEDEALNEDGSVKMLNMVSWAKRVGGVKGLGVGEFNGLNTDGSTITKPMNVIKSEPLFKWALEWNSADSGVGLYLSGQRLTAFKAGLATTNPL